MRKTLQMQLVENQQGGDIDDLLIRELEAGHTYAQIGAAWGVHQMTIQRWIEQRRLKRSNRWQREAVAA